MSQLRRSSISIVYIRKQRGKWTEGPEIANEVLSLPDLLKLIQAHFHWSIRLGDRA